MPDSLIKLSSGRTLGFAEYGDPVGTPLLYFHGWPSCRLQAELLDEAGKSLSLRIIAPDRPGIGISEFHPGRTLSDWPSLIIDLVEHVGADQFYVLGVSGGGPYVLACAHAMPERLLGAGVVCGAPPLHEVGTEGLFWGYRLALWAQRRLPFMVGPGLRAAGWMAGRELHRWPMHWILRSYPPADRQAFENRNLGRIMMESCRVAVLGDTHAVRHDGLIYSSDWGFNLEDILYPIRFWHGAQDKHIPLALAQKAFGRIPGATLKIYPNDGHNSLPLLHCGDFAAELVGAQQGSAKMLK